MVGTELVEETDFDDYFSEDFPNEAAEIG